MHFDIGRDTGTLARKSLFYDTGDFAFYVSPVADNFSSVLVNDINLEIDPNGVVISIWGLCPYMNWIDAVLGSPQAGAGEVRFVGDSPITRGVSIRLNRERWPTYVDRSNGWIYIAGTAKPTQVVAIMTGVIIELDEQRNLCGIWLKPAQLP